MTASTVLITGAGPGIDRAPARDAAARGHDVIIAGRRVSPPLTRWRRAGAGVRSPPKSSPPRGGRGSSPLAAG
jgi:NAD(P)-dependent dehydrogenase (short-subunit alcohol dehydrogenase family)